MTGSIPATVWASTWVPSKSPVDGFGEDGYAVAWADLGTGGREQVLVLGEAPSPGVRGVITERSLGGADIRLFIASGEP